MITILSELMARSKPNEIEDVVQVVYSSLSTGAVHRYSNLAKRV
jgi:hypothetical protein